MLRSILCCALVTLPAMAQPNLPFIFSAQNSASYDTTIAQGSIFIVSGMNLGPAQLVQASSNPLPMQLGGTSITVTSGSTTAPCPMVYSVIGAASAVLPSNVPPGRATVTLTYNGQSTPFPVPVNVVPSAVGIYTVGSSGLGPGVFTGADGSAKTFAVTARNGETVTAWATGLGPISGPANAVPSAFPNFPGVEVFVGTQAATVTYAGRSGCCVGLDQISFEVPAGVAGCYVPVAVRSGGAVSNFVSIALNSGGEPCSDTAPTIPISVMNQAMAGQSVKAAALAAGPVSVLQGLGFNEKLYLAATLSRLLHVKLSQQDVEKLLLAGQTHNRRALTRAMSKYAASWKALNPAAKAAVQAALNSNQEGAVAAFGQFSTPGALAAAVGGLFPSQGTCTPLPSGSGGRSGMGLDAGSSLALSGQAGAWTLTPSRTGQYQALFGSAPSGRNLPPGTYAITGSGGRDVTPFSATLSVGGNIVWTNKAAISTIDRSRPLTTTWSGGTSPGYVLVGGYVDSGFGALVGFVCAEDASKGSFTIPSFILSVLPPGGGGMFISPHPLSRQVTIPGVDLAYFVDGSNDAKSVSYQVAGLQIVSGNLQSAGLNQPFSAPLTVEAIDAQGNPVSNASITWYVTAGTALILNRFSFTNASGQASVNVIAESPGAVTITAATGYLTAQFTLTATSGLTTPACAAFPAGFVPFTSVAYRSAPDSAGNTLIVGAVPLANLSVIEGLPLPVGPNQEFCGAVNLGGGYNVTAYVPTAAERAGDFSAFGGVLINPINNLPFPNNQIPQSLLGQVYPWRIPPQ